MIKSFTKDGFYYYCKGEYAYCSQWARVDEEDNHEDWLMIWKSPKRLRRVDVVGEFSEMDYIKFTIEHASLGWC